MPSFSLWLVSITDQIDLRGTDPRPRRLVKVHVYYSKTFVKQPLSKRQKIGFQDQLLLNACQK